MRNQMFERMDAAAAKTKFPRINISQGFAEDYTEYQAERTAVSNVIRQYLAPIQAGFVDDVDGAIADFLQRAEAAGLQRCRDGWTAQWLAYCDEFGYK
jgi:putative aldouronate transport system substrate-binding protein